jgi:penicillin-binding protein 2
MAHAVGALSVGKRYRPRLVLRLEGPSGDVVETIPEQVTGDLELKPGVLEEVRQGLIEVVNGPRGTGKNAALEGVVVAGKTGTSQVVTIGAKRKRPEEMPWEQRDHAWFVAFAPAADPEVALAVLVEHASGGGGKVAAPIARAVMEDFFRLKQQRGPVRYAEN